jgi:hypothetical protein
MGDGMLDAGDPTDKFIGSPEDLRFARLVMKDGSQVEVSEAELAAILEPGTYRLAYCQGCDALIPWGHHYCEREASWDEAELGLYMEASP